MLHLFRKLKEKRKKIQEQNKKKKDLDKLSMKEKSLKGMQKAKLETDIIMQKAARESNAETAVAEDDDREYYRQEVGEEPDKGKILLARKSKNLRIYILLKHICFPKFFYFCPLISFYL